MGSEMCIRDSELLLGDGDEGARGRTLLGLSRRGERDPAGPEGERGDGHERKDEGGSAGGAIHPDDPQKTSCGGSSGHVCATSAWRSADTPLMLSSKGHHWWRPGV